MNKSIKSLVYWRRIHHQPVNIKWLVGTAHGLIKETRKEVSGEVGNLLGYELLAREDLRQGVYRRNKLKYKINGRAYAYVPKINQPTKKIIDIKIVN